MHLRLMQDSVRHNTPPTTALYTPLTAKADVRAREALARLMDAL